MTEHTASTESDTVAIAEAFARALHPGDWVGLIGPLGAGKSVFARAVGRALGVRETMPSPTYTLMNVLHGTIPVYHIDLYRMSSADELDFAGIGPYFESSGICLVEWADRIREHWPDRGWLVTIAIGELSERRITIAPLHQDS
ncbi:MAG: hypothetical protein Kow0074_10380 [Candidatus Zixiibacteriota bacterium]